MFLRGRGARVFGRLVIGASLLWLTLTLLALVYPHQNHNTEWVQGKPGLNYPIDIAVGVVMALGAVVVWRLAGPRRRSDPSGSPAPGAEE